MRSLAGRIIAWRAIKHGVNLFGVLVGDTAKGRKGTSWGRVRQVMTIADPEWTAQRVHTRLSSGERVIWAVRDPITAFEKQGKVRMPVSSRSKATRA
jgi:hypothetical protein